MIFVTVGTHEQQFNRLVQYIDELKEQCVITDRVVIQTGYSTYKPQSCEWREFFTYEEMKTFVSDAKIIITHGGPSSFIMPLQMGKVPIVVPRKCEFEEHVNNHQVNFCRIVADRMQNVIVVEDITQLGEIILRYDDITSRVNHTFKSNNSDFVEKLRRMIDAMFM